jgi:mercuric ion binding protein
MKNQLKKLLAVLVIATLCQPLFAAEKIVTLDVKNMTCAMCPITVKKSLEKVDGVSAVKISYDDKTALVTFDDATTNDKVLTEATTNAGYPSSVKVN